MVALSMEPARVGAVAMSARFRPLDFLDKGDNPREIEGCLQETGCVVSNTSIRTAEVVCLVKVDGELHLMRANEQLDPAWELIRKPSRAQFLIAIGKTKIRPR